ncbi:MAG: Flp pilus assembly protein CpaB [Anaerolineae bacterium]
MGRLRGLLWLTAGLIVAVMAGAVGFMTLSRAAAQTGGAAQETGPQVPVVVTTGAVAVRSALAPADLELRQVPVELAPEGAVASLEDAEGMITLVDLYPGEVLLAQRLADPNLLTAEARFSLLVETDKVLMAVPASDLMCRSGTLKPGDHVDLLFTLDVPIGMRAGFVASSQDNERAADGEEPMTFNVLQNGVISALVAGQAPYQVGDESNAGPETIFLTLNAQDALVLKFVKDKGGILDVVLRAPGAEQPFEVEPVDVDYVINRFELPVEPGR